MRFLILFLFLVLTSCGPDRSACDYKEKDLFDGHDVLFLNADDDVYEMDHFLYFKDGKEVVVCYGEGTNVKVGILRASNCRKASFDMVPFDCRKKGVIDE